MNVGGIRHGLAPGFQLSRGIRGSCRAACSATSRRPACSCQKVQST